MKILSIFANMKYRILLFILLVAVALTAAPEKKNRPVYIIPVEGMIDLGLAPFVERVISKAEADRAGAIIIRVNTFGGRLDAAVKIKDALLNTNLKTIAFIDKRAISAGALISLAADSIVMAGGATIGAATPVDQKGNKLTEKQVSYMRAEMRATAEQHGRPASLAEAMVDESLVVDSLVGEGKLLTLTTAEAIKRKIADLEVRTLEELLEKMGLHDAAVREFSENWAEKVVRFLSHPIVSSLLLTIGMLGIIFEVKSPGWGVGGTIGLLALVLFFGSHYIVNLAGWGEIILFAAGVLLLALEVLVIPGFGIAGILGIICIAASIVLSLLGHMPSQGDITAALFSVITVLVVTGVLTVVMFRTMPGNSVFGRLILNTGLGAAPEKPAAPAQAPDGLTPGLRGSALSDLHPSGTGSFDGRRLDVISEGDYIAKGAALEITEVHGNRIVVRQV